MVVLRDNKSGIGSKSAVNKLVIIRILFYQPQLKLRVEKLHIIAIHQSIHNMLGHNRTCLCCNYFLVLRKNVIRNAQNIATFM